MRTAVVLLTGIDPEPMTLGAMGVVLDVPGAVVVRHDIDVEREVLTRWVSDASGVVEHAEVDLAHACVACAIREDLVPTIERVARDGRWTTVVAQLPVGAAADQLSEVLSHDPCLARHLRVASVVTSLAAGPAADDLLGDDLLRERGRHSSADDVRGVGEVACAMVERADAVLLTGPAATAPGGLVARDLVSALARPDATVVVGVESVDGAALVGARHRGDRARAWTDPAGDGGTSTAVSDRVWQVVLEAPGPFHPDRLLDGLSSLGAGRHRSRGGFWLPTRPGRLLLWDGAGGQLSIGDGGGWGSRLPRVRLLLTGTGSAPDGLEEAFAAMLLSPDEVERRTWREDADGFEPWLGPISRAA